VVIILRMVAIGASYTGLLPLIKTLAGSYAGAGYLLSTLNVTGNYVEYGRWLDLDRALVRTQWSQNSATFLRTSFCSNPTQACVEHINSTQPLPSVTYALSPHLETGLPASEVICHDNATLRLRGTVAEPGVLYELLGRAHAIGGSVSCNVVDGTNGTANATLKIEGGASDVWFTWVGGTEYDMDAGDAAHNFSFRGADPHEALLGLLTSATTPGSSFTSLLEEHIADYTATISKFDLDLNQTPDFDTPTDELWNAYRTDIGDAYVEWLIFHLGRYMLVESSRGALPANLQGKWASDIANAWSGGVSVVCASRMRP
jgi:alpha-L-fucosidase 2